MGIKGLQFGVGRQNVSIRKSPKSTPPFITSMDETQTTLIIVAKAANLKLLPTVLT